MSDPPVSSMPTVIVFDLDNTLAESKQAITSDMAEALAKLLERTTIGVMSGGKLEQLKRQIADRVPELAERNSLYLLPTSGAALAAYEDGSWTVLEEKHIPEEEAKGIMKVMETAARGTGCIDFDQPSYGPRLEYRGSQVSLSALGQQAPIHEKEMWDPDRAKRAKLRRAIAAALPDYDVRSGGLTTIDVTRKGVDKAYGIRSLSIHLGISIDRMLYVGDALYPGGNDEVVIATGIPTHAVKNPNETLAFIRELLD